MSKIYTKKGDKGETTLATGGRIKKSSKRVDAYGHVDEVIAFIGNAIVEIEQEGLPQDMKDFISETLDDVQDCLMKVSATLALANGISLAEEDLTLLEEKIDLIQSRLPPLSNFTLPGVLKSESAIHIARVVCRRAERRIVSLAQDEYVPPLILKYMNRLSDLLFVLARLCITAHGSRERIWFYKRKG